VEVKPIPRSYRSPRREEQAAETRRRIVDAARELFAAQGYAGSSLAAIADRAGVSVPTVYNSVGGKPGLLAALNDVVDETGDVAGIGRRIGTTTDPVEIVRLTARLRRLLMEGAGDIVVVLSEAAAADPDVAAAYRAGQERSRAGTRGCVERLRALGALKPGLDPGLADDAVYAVMHHAVWTRLVDECGWTADAAEAWYAETLGQLLLEAPPGRS
jgi:AcrR family transcriptional regulator